MILVNFSHPITDLQKQQIETLTNLPLTEIFDQMPQLDEQKAFQPQIRQLLNQIPLDGRRWQTAPILVNLPGYTPAAASLLAELHGFIGHFPAIVRIRPKAESNPRVYEVAEIINLQAMREDARKLRDH